MSTDSRELTSRYVNSYDEYFTNIHDDRLLAMSINPLLATRGLDDIIALLGDEHGTRFKEKTHNLLTRSIHKLAQKMLEKQRSESRVANDVGGESII